MLSRARRLTLSSLILVATLTRPTLLPAKPPADEDLKNRITRATCEKELAAEHWTEALPACQAVLKVAEQLLGPENESVAYWLQAVGQVLYQIGIYDAADPLLKRSLMILERALGPEHPDVATYLNNLALLYQEQGRHAEAEPLYQRSLHIGVKVMGPEHPELARSLNNLAGLYQAQGRYTEAEPLLQRCLRIQEKALRPEHPQISASLSNLAALYLAQGRYAEAEPLLLRSLHIGKQALGPEHPHLSTVLNSLAELYRAQGRYAEAEPLYQRSLQIREKVLGPKHPMLATSLNNLALLYRAQGRYAEAESLYQRSLRIEEEVPDPKRPELATSLNNLAQLYRAQGRYADAEPLYQRSLHIGEKVLGPEHPRLATFLNNLANFYAEGDHPAQALPHLETLLERSLHRNGLFHGQSLIAIEQLATVHQQLGQIQQVGAVWSRFLSELSSAGLPRQWVSEHVRRKLAMLLERAFFHYWLQRRFDDAAQTLAQADSLPQAKDAVMAATLDRMWVRLAAASASHRQLLLIHTRLTKGQDDTHALRLLMHGLEAAALGRMAEATPFLSDGLYFAERHLRQQKSTKAVAAWLGQERPYLDLIFELVRKQPRDASTLSLAWTATLLSKGRTLDAKTKARRVLPQAAQHNPTLWRMQEDVKNRWRQGVIGGTGGGELRGLGQQVRDMEANLAQFSDAMRIEVLPEPFEIVRAVAAEVPKDGVLVDFVEYVPPRLGTDDGEGTARYLALLLFPAEGAAEPRMQALDLGEVRAHAPRIKDLLAALRDPTSQPQKQAQEVYDALLAPVRKAAGAVTQLWLVPDGALNLIPFDALHDGTQYLLDSPLRVRYLASGRDLVFSYGASSGRPPLVLGNPRQDTAAPLPAAPVPEKDKAAPAAARRRRGADLRSASLFDALGNLGSLPAAEAEAEQIAGQLHVTPLLGAHASEPALRGKLGPGLAPRILHLAMHGLFPEDLAHTTAFGERSRSSRVEFAPGMIPNAPPAPAALGSAGESVAGAASSAPAAVEQNPSLDEPMLQSALALAGAAKAREATDSKADGVLTADEARELPLEGTELVVLSACQTALGSIRVGDGVYGLRRAFLAAGAEAVVASLWRVADNQTRSLMTKYYELLIQKREPRISAMRQAMQAIKKDHPHPYYWAPFIAIGRDEPIRPLDIPRAAPSR